MKRPLLILLLMAVLPAGAAITHVGTPTTATWTSGTSNTISSHTVDAGSDRILVVGIAWRAPGSNTVSSVTWDTAGVNEAFTKLRNDASPNGQLRTEWWYRAAPTAKTADITIVVNSMSGRIAAGAANYQGVNQTTPVEAENGSGSNGATSLTTSVTTLTDNAWLVAVTGQRGGNEAMAITSPGTERWERANGNPSLISSNGGDEAIASAGSADIQATWTSSGACSQSVGVLKDAAAAADDDLMVIQ